MVVRWISEPGRVTVALARPAIAVAPYAAPEMLLFGKAKLPFAAAIPKSVLLEITLFVTTQQF
jgi:hypothetical protein